MANENIQFEILETDIEEQNAERNNKRVRCWVGTWNNPKMTDDEFRNHLMKLYNEDYLQYAIFQREKGEESGIEHFQFFVDFKNARYFKWVKENLPYGCHFKPMRSSKTQCRDYCSKKDTRISKDYYEIGDFIENGHRTDLSKIMAMLKEKIPFKVVQEIYPSQCIMYKRQLMDYAQGILNEENKKKQRDLKVIYIYGAPGTGKSSYVYNTCGEEDVFCVDMYDKSMFTLYDNEKIIFFDEFTGKIDITYMNKLLDRYRVQLRGLNTVKYACYETVYIVSNLPLSGLYKKEQEENKIVYDAFLRRIGKVIRFDSIGVMHVEKNIYKTGYQYELPAVSNDLPFSESEELDF